VFLKLGATGFGGPAAFIAMMDAEVVERRAWLSRAQFLDLLGVTNLIPGPNATEMAIHVGYRRAGVAGLVVAGASFILPAVLITYVLAWLYVQYGSLPQVDPFLRGINPVVLAIILIALRRLAVTALGRWQLLLVGTWAAVAVMAGCDAVLCLALGTAAGMVLVRFSGVKPQSGKPTAAGAVVLASGMETPSLAPAAAAAAGTAACVALSTADVLWRLFLFFLKVGAVLYGGGYVLIAYLQDGLVEQYQWLSEKQLLDAIAVGQFTPGPILSTATFVGYLIAGGAGAAVATLGVFLPSFLFVAAVNPLIPRLRSAGWAARFLDAVNATSVGLMAGATVLLARHALIDWRSWLLAAVAAAVLLGWRVAPAWLVLGGAAAGWLLW
jgi:chromate transporter